MSREISNITTPILLRFSVVSGTWTELEDVDAGDDGWEFSPGAIKNVDLHPSEEADDGGPYLELVPEPTNENVDLDPSEESDGGGPRSEFIPESTDEKVELDAWEIRNEFLELQHDDREALRKFLGKTGAFGWLNEYRGLKESELWKFQAAIRRQLLRPTVSKNETKFATDFEGVIHNRIQSYVMNAYVGLVDGKVIAEAEAANTFDAIVSTIFIDRLRKLRFKVCQRPDCAAIYKLTSRHTRKFCSYNCAHVMTVRRSRKAQKKKKGNNKNKNKKQTFHRSPSLAVATSQHENVGPGKR